MEIDMIRFTPYLIAGIVFGYTLIKAEVASWYRIQEMFHFQSFHMFGLIISAVLTAMIGIQLIKHLQGIPSFEGPSISIPKKKPGFINYPLGGFIFGIGWGTIGLCPGPIFALVGSGSLSTLFVLLGALHGTWLYGVMRNYLPTRLRSNAA
jgi:uncharacterized membrane protein YedE/YeeE